MGLRARKASVASPSCSKCNPVTWVSEMHDPESSMKVEVLVVFKRKNAMWSLWWGQIGAMQYYYSVFWSRVMPSGSRELYTIWKELLAGYWALKEIEHLNLGHQVTMFPEMPIMSWILSDLPRHKVGQTQQKFILRWSGTSNRIGIKQRTQGSCRNRWSRHLCHPPLLHWWCTGGVALQISPMGTWNGASLMTSCKQEKS